MKNSQILKELPNLRGEYLYIPFVGAIIEREFEGKKQILVQVRQKKSDTQYSGSIEIPGGKFRAFEDVYETLCREVKEESGLDITFIEGQNERKDYLNRNDVSSLIKPFCVTQMSNGPFIGLIFLCKGKGTLVQQTNETKQVRWIDVDDLRSLIENEQENIYTAFLGALKKYIEIR